MSLPTDPISEVLDAIWTRLEQNTTFTSKVKPGNRVKITGDQGGQQKTNTQDADKPAVRITPAGGIHQPWRSSHTAIFSQVYAIEVSTSDERLNQDFGIVKFAILCSLQSLDNLKATLSYVNAITELTHEDQDNASTMDNGTPGWSTVYRVRVDMAFARSEMNTAAGVV